MSELNLPPHIVAEMKQKAMEQMQQQQKMQQPVMQVNQMAFNILLKSIERGVSNIEGAVENAFDTAEIFLAEAANRRAKYVGEQKMEERSSNRPT